MRARILLPLCILFSGLFMVACGQKDSTGTGPQVIRLFDVFAEEDLTGNVTLANADWERTEWQASEIGPLETAPSKTPPVIGFRALNGVEELQLANNLVSAQLTGDAPVIQFSLDVNRGGASRVKYVDLRMTVSGAGKVWLRAEGAKAVTDESILDWAKSEEWNLSEDVDRGASKIYRFDVTQKGERDPEGSANNLPPGLPPLPGDGEEKEPATTTDASGDLRHFFLTLRDCENATLSISSIRFVTEKEDKLNEPSGQQWAGLSEIFRETLAAKTTETLRIPLRELPSRPWFDVNIGTTEEMPVTFTASIARREGSDVSESKILLKRTITTPDRWQELRIDLSEYAGESAVLELSLTGDKKGLWGYWGAPTIRNSLASEDLAESTPRGIIFLVADTLRPDHLNIYGYERETLVHLKKFAEEGVAFRNVVAQSTWTKVSQPSMITSMYPISTTAVSMQTALPASAETIAEVYRDAGFATVSFSSVPFTGKMNNMHQGYEELHEVSFGRMEEEYGAKSSRKYVDRLISWLEQHQDVRFFAFLHVFDPHSPFRPRPPYDTIWGRPGDKERVEEIDKQIKELEVKNTFGLPFKDDYVEKTGNDPDELLRIYTDWYDGSIRGMDAEMGRLFEALRELGLEDDTLIVLSSDHGEELWEHGQFFHGQSVYGELSQVPLVFRWPNSPRVRKGAMVDGLVENIDIMPTLLELSGIEGPSAMQGRSLTPLLDGSGEEEWQERLAVIHTITSDHDVTDLKSEQFPHFGIVENGWKLVRKKEHPDLAEELYDRAVDPFDLNDLISAAGQRERADGIAGSFAEWKTRMESAKLPSDEEMSQTLSSEELRRLQALGYVGGGVQASPAEDTAEEEPAEAETQEADAE